jgi:hypothetical protein
VIPEVAIVIPPEAFVTEIPDPGVNVALVNPVPFPIFSWPLVGMEVNPVPPLVTAMAVPLQTPLVIVPTLVKLEAVTLLAKVVPVNVLDAAAIVISALPSNATPLIFFEVVSLLAVLAVPDNVPMKLDELTLLNPVTEV